ncbi:unnamed protein product [Aureobasidium uvarum]|uniref:Uncharacterized protein n=1 Tax=Aureobasidium uvarum TaxID=2773716 RepID=A0A9N8PT41_9PEZI|nr:unnamed protein product [Aureobasidium uvarum]
MKKAAEEALTKKRAEDARKRKEEAAKAEQKRREEEIAKAARTQAERAALAVTTGLASPFDFHRSNHAARHRTQALANILNYDDEEQDAMPGTEDDTCETRSIMPERELAFELDELEDLLRTMAESLRTEDADRMRAQEAERTTTDDDTQNQTSPTGWSGTCTIN